MLGKNGSLLGRDMGIVVRLRVLFIPGVGPLLVAGPLVGWIVGGLEGALVVGGLSALGAGFYSLGIPKDSILQYETAIKSGKFVIIAHGSTEETARARDIINRTNPDSSAEHRPSCASTEPCLVSAN